jgi:putative peptidoglycan lipid II flippase
MAATRVSRSRRRRTIAADVPDPDPGQGSAAESGAQRERRLGLNTAFFAVATGLSRIAGLAREIVVAGYFGVTGQMTAFTVAFQVPNLIRALVADMALQGAFVPVFSELLEKGNRREAFRVASTVIFLIVLVLGALTGLFILLAPVIMPLFLPGLPQLAGLTVALSQILFPIVLLLALTGVVVGMLNSFEHFAVPALTPLAWNLVIIASLVGLVPIAPTGDEIYAYAIGIVIATLVQLLMPLPLLRGRGGGLSLTLDWRNPHVIRIFKLMIPVTITLGLINFSGIINSFVGSFVNESTPAAIDKAFRIYMLPQGMFSIAVATVLFPTLSKQASRGELDNVRNTMGNGVRQIFMFLIPSAVIMGVLAVPITRLIYQRGAFDAEATGLVATAMLVWAISLPFQGASLMFSRTFFSLQRPWVTAILAGLSLGVNAVVALALYPSLGIAGVVGGTVVATIALMLAQMAALRGMLNGVDGTRMLSATVRMVLAAAALGVVCWFAWAGLDALLGRGLGGPIVSVGGSIAAGLVAYGALVWAMRVPEAEQVWRLIAGRFTRSA